MIDRRGYVEIGYIYTYLISALLLASIISVSINLTIQSEESSVEMLLQDVANRLAVGIEKAILQVRLHSESRGEINISINISFQSELQGRYTVLEYNITATNATVYINTTKVKVCSSINNPGTVNVTGTVIGYIIARESLTGCTNTIRISYNSEDNVIEVKA